MWGINLQTNLIAKFKKHNFIENNDTIYFPLIHRQEGTVGVIVPVNEDTLQNFSKVILEKVGDKRLFFGIQEM